ncbi:MAG: PDZ domain-containing protein, partial [Nostocaceae cyanobacterium]|nr:PDZ domain-containing protein [Nostocaceae cyanobacterium]
YSTGRVEHPFLGIQMVDLTSAKKDEINKDTKLNIKADKGVLIARVMDKSPAEKGGLQSGDLIQKINRQLVRNSAEVQQLVESSSVGAVLQIEISRNEKTQILKVESGAFPNE